MFARRRRITAAAGLVAVTLGACGGPSASPTTTSTTPPPPTPTPVVTPEPTPVPTPTPTPTPTPRPAQTLARPVIVQVENLAVARPQSGLSEADVVVEYEVEGGLTRFSAVFLNAPQGAVGPVRSARTITVQLTSLYSAALMFSGAGSYVLGLLRSAGLLAFDETSAAGDLFRVAARGAPHNLYTDGAHISALLARAAGSSTLALPQRVDVSAATGGTPAARVLVPVSFAEQPVYTWDATAGGWTRTEHGTGVSIDADTGKPWEPATVAVLQVPVTTDVHVTDAAGSHGVDHAITGSGPAEILSGGRMYAGRFTQGATGLPVLTLADGSPAPIAPGQLLIVYTRTGLTPRILG